MGSRRPVKGGGVVGAGFEKEGGETESNHAISGGLMRGTVASSTDVLPNFADRNGSSREMTVFVYFLLWK